MFFYNELFKSNYFSNYGFYIKNITRKVKNIVTSSYAWKCREMITQGGSIIIILCLHFYTVNRQELSRCQILQWQMIKSLSWESHIQAVNDVYVKTQCYDNTLVYFSGILWIISYIQIHNPCSLQRRSHIRIILLVSIVINNHRVTLSWSWSHYDI